MDSERHDGRCLAGFEGVEGQLRGSVERIWEADGLRVEIDLPLDMLRRSARLRSRTVEEAREKS